MIHVHTLSNGIQVVTEPVGNYRTAAFGLWVSAGSADETPQNNGIAHVIEHMLFKGTGTRSARRLSDEIASIGGGLDAYTTREYTCFVAHTLDTHLLHAIRLIADMVTDPLIAENDLQKELGVIMEEIDMYEDDPEDLANDLLYRSIWRGQPIGFPISGTKETVRRLTRSDVLDFMARYYIGSRMTISVAGHFDEAEVLTAIEREFGAVRSGLRVARAGGSDRAPEYFHSLVFKDKPLEQMHLCLAFPCIPCHHELRYVYYVADNIVGGNQNSRLFQEVREEKGLAYAIYSYGTSLKKCGVFQIYAAANPAQLPRLLEAISETLTGLAHRPVSAHELELAKAQIEAEIMIGAESTQSRMESNGEALINHAKIDTLDTTLKNIETVTLEQVRQFIEKYMINVRPSVCVVGDERQYDVRAVRRWEEKISEQE